MSRFFTLISILLFSSVLVFAEGLPSGTTVARDDHNDSGPIQVGYAVVTPNSSGLVVFATYGLREDGGLAPATRAGVLPPDLTTDALLFVDRNLRLLKNIGVAIVNPNGSKVTVNFTLRKADGTSVATATLDISSHHQVAEMVTQLFSGSTIPSDITGTLEITSTSPISVIGLRFRGANFSTIPATNLAGDSGPLPNITADAGGANAILIPQFAAGGGWATELVMVNTSSSAMTVRVDLFKQDGTSLTTALNGQSASSFIGINIPAGGVAVLAPRDSDGDDDF